MPKYLLIAKPGGFKAVQCEVLNESEKSLTVRPYSFIDGQPNSVRIIRKTSLVKAKWFKEFDDVSAWRRAGTDHLNSLKKRVTARYPYRHAEDGGAY